MVDGKKSAKDVKEAVRSSIDGGTAVEEQASFWPEGGCEPQPTLEQDAAANHRRQKFKEDPASADQTEKVIQSVLATLRAECGWLSFKEIPQGIKLESAVRERLTPQIEVALANAHVLSRGYGPKQPPNEHDATSGNDEQPTSSDDQGLPDENEEAAVQDSTPPTSAEMVDLTQMSDPLPALQHVSDETKAKRLKQVKSFNAALKEARQGAKEQDDQFCLFYQLALRLLKIFKTRAEQYDRAVVLGMDIELPSLIQLPHSINVGEMLRSLCPEGMQDFTSDLSTGVCAWLSDEWIGTSILSFQTSVREGRYYLSLDARSWLWPDDAMARALDAAYEAQIAVFAPTSDVLRRLSAASNMPESTTRVVFEYNPGRHWVTVCVDIRQNQAGEIEVVIIIYDSLPSLALFGTRDHIRLRKFMTLLSMLPNSPFSGVDFQAISITNGPTYRQTNSSDCGIITARIIHKLLCEEEPDTVNINPLSDRAQSLELVSHRLASITGIDEDWCQDDSGIDDDRDGDDDGPLAGARAELIAKLKRLELGHWITMRILAGSEPAQMLSSVLGDIVQVTGYDKARLLKATTRPDFVVKQPCANRDGAWERVRTVEKFSPLATIELSDSHNDLIRPQQDDIPSVAFALRGGHDADMPRNLDNAVGFIVNSRCSEKAIGPQRYNRKLRETSDLFEKFVLACTGELPTNHQKDLCLGAIFNHASTYSLWGAGHPGQLPNYGSNRSNVEDIVSRLDQCHSSVSDSTSGDSRPVVYVLTIGLDGASTNLDSFAAISSRWPNIRLKLVIHNVCCDIPFARAFTEAPPASGETWACYDFEKLALACAQRNQWTTMDGHSQLAFFLSEIDYYKHGLHTRDRDLRLDLLYKKRYLAVVLLGGSNGRSLHRTLRGKRQSWLVADSGNKLALRHGKRTSEDTESKAAVAKRKKLSEPEESLKPEESSKPTRPAHVLKISPQGSAYVGLLGS